ncbi:hypothetical protein CDAR_465171 [Caerostris darwini]|uniref:Uncharacterized protein n=1 Tax=Caerostris darwini TaxID=1538125 RepID=A0AAV4V2H0_9ARAC|nr:hypothetical protein CDAR_465171 [Caerostris darwini]
MKATRSEWNQTDPTQRDLPLKETHHSQISDTKQSFARAKGKNVRQKGQNNDYKNTESRYLLFKNVLHVHWGNLSPHDTLAESQAEQLQGTSSMEDVSSNFSREKVESISRQNEDESAFENSTSSPKYPAFDCSCNNRSEVHY